MGRFDNPDSLFQNRRHNMIKSIRDRFVPYSKGLNNRGGRLFILGFLVQKVPNFLVQNGGFKRNYSLINQLIALVDVSDA